MEVYGYLILVFSILLISFGLILLYFYKRQEKLIFHPEKLPLNHQFTSALDFEEGFIKVTSNIKLNTLLFKANEPKGIIFFCHGNAGSMASWNYLAKEFVKHGWHFFIWDYRGYGKSNGRIKRERVLINDAEKVYNKVSIEYKNLPIGFVGCSLGTGIAANLASKFKTSFLILITPYFNFKHTVDYHYPFLPTSWLLKYKFKSNEFVINTECSVYLIHGTNDHTVPYESSVMLQKISPERIKLLTLDGGLHSNFSDFDSYSLLIKQILTY